MSIALDLFCITVAVTMPSAAELSVFIGVGGWVKPSPWIVILRGAAVCPLWNSPPTSASAVDATTCLRIMHSMWIGTFAGDGRLEIFRSVGSKLR